MCVPNYTVDPNSSQIQLVGRLDLEAIHNILGVTFPSAEVYLYPGVIKHIRKEGHFPVFEKYCRLIPGIIARPDYIGQHPKIPNSLELYKVVQDQLLIALKLDPSGYMYLSSFYKLDNGKYKLSKRLRSGRIVPFVPSNASLRFSEG